MPNWKTYESSVRLLSAIVAAHPGLKLNYDEIASIMGSDVTPNGIRFQFTDRFKPIAKRQLEMRGDGLDAKDIDLDSVKGAGSTNKSNRKAIAKEYGDGVTGGSENGSAKKTPTKRGPRAKKVAPPKTQTMAGSSGEDDEEGNFDTPSKKTPLHKVKNGRVTKSSGRAKTKVNYQESDNEENEDDNDFEIVKEEQGNMNGFDDIHYPVRNGNTNGHGHANGHAESSFEDPAYSQGYEGGADVDYWHDSNENAEA